MQTRVLPILALVLLWGSGVMAQEEATGGGGLAPGIVIMLLIGIAAVSAVGYRMYERDQAEANETQAE